MIYTRKTNPFSWRLTRTDHGKVMSKDDTWSYTEVYTQPVWRFVVAKAYHHVWEEHTWRVWRYLERFQIRESWADIPFSNRQEIRCFDLMHKSRVRVSWEEE